MGPFCKVGPDVILAEGVHLLSHVVVEGHTTIGPRTVVHPFTMLGGPPQHLRYKGEPTRLEIGADCEIREQVSIQRGTVGGGGLTTVGHNVLIMAQVHIGHDDQIGNHVIFAGNSTLAGHVSVGDHAIIGGVVGIHQFCRIGERAMVGGCAAVPMDVIPFGSALGNHARLGGLNLVGMKRMGLTREAIHTTRRAFHDLFLAEGPPFRARVDEVAARYAASPEVASIVAFIRADAHRPILPARASRFAAPGQSSAD
ncbi:MAG: acyl-[acyl-carrier-protein]--UDP-N-acetylglucosamine O-acyltransferase [Rhodobacterales bacterium 17-64-5]|nr:MAG: acyl-[acyl-carrier-protein]--UDP-N-acetylglucosamine O-acyltransferase [Rhodobacterales bacterium 17-64-5]